MMDQDHEPYFPERNFMRPNRSSANRAFSLFEMMTILLIISLLVALSVPALIPTLQSRSLTAVGDQFEQTLKNARQIALAEDVVIDFELIGVDQPGSGGVRFDGYRVWKWLPNGERREVDKIQWLDGDFVFSQSHSTLITDGAAEQETTTVTELDETAEIIRFSIFPNGETNLPERADSDNWHVTICTPPIGGQLPPNFIAYRINQTNAHVMGYRPR